LGFETAPLHRQKSDITLVPRYEYKKLIDMNTKEKQLIVIIDVQPKQITMKRQKSDIIQKSPAITVWSLVGSILL
jgi:hypothetical protein